MTEYQKIRNSVVGVPVEQIVNKAGEISSTVDDITLWETVSNGAEPDLKIDDGKLALSTSAATTIENAENITRFQKLWNRSPAAWKSGSDLVIPAQGTSKEYTAYINESATVISEEGDWIDSIAINSNRIDITIKSGIFTNTPHVQVTTKSQSAASRTSYIRDLNSGLIGIYTTDATGAYVNDTRLFVTATNAGDSESSPIIYIADNVLSSSLGLPVAGAESKGLVNLNQIAEGNRNYIINGDFAINQRGTSFVSSGAEYTSDRWRKDDTSSSQNQVTINDETNVFNGRQFEKYIKFKSGNTNAGILYLGQRIEDVRETASKTMTLSVVARSTQSTELRFSWQQNFGSGGDTSVTSSYVLQETLTAGFSLYKTTFTLPSVDTKTIGTSDFLNCYFEIDADGTTNPEADILYVKLEEGTEASKFTRAGGTYAGELALCEWYYEKGHSTALYAFGASITNGNGMGVINYSSPKRSTPTVITFYDTFSGAAGQVRGTGGTAINVTTNSNIDSATVINNSGGSIAFTAYSFGWEADCEL